MTVDIERSIWTMSFVIGRPNASHGSDPHRAIRQIRPLEEASMSDGKIRIEAHDRIFKIIIDNPAKKNAFSPQMMDRRRGALTELHTTPTAWVGVFCAEGKVFPAGLDMPKFFGPTAEKRNFKEGNVDAFALQKRCKKPIVTAVQG